MRLDKATRKKRRRTSARADKSAEKKSRFGGARIRVSFSVVVMAAIAVSTGYVREVLSYAAAVILHEFSHATVAARLGYTLDSLKIMPYGAALTGEFEGARSKDEIAIAIAGPLSNLIFAVSFVALWWLIPSLFYYTEIYVAANVFTALVNILPLFPLDGGRVALALASIKTSRAKAYKVLRVVGVVLSAAGIVCAALNFRRLNFSYFTFLIFVFVSAVIPDKSCKYRRLYDISFRMERIKSGLPIREIMISKDACLSDCLRLLGTDYYTRFVVTDEKLSRLGEVDETTLEDCLSRLSVDSPIADILPLVGGGSRHG